MRADFEDSAHILHHGEKGAVREYDLLAFLQKYVPANVLAVGSAEIISTDGQRSPQMDIVICDRSTPPIFDRGGYRIVPAECVYAVIEVKSSLDAEEMRKSRLNIAQVKRMPKTAFFPQMITMQPQVYGRQWDGYFPTLGFIFAYDSIALSNFVDDQAIRALRQQPYSKRIDAVWVLGKGLLNWVDPRTKAPNVTSEPGLWLAAGEVPPDSDVLLNLVLLLATRLTQVTMPPFNLTPYADNADMATNVEAKGPVDYEESR